MPWIRDECMNLSKKEIKELVELDARCFDPPINYSSRDIKFYTLHPEAILLREYEKKTLIAYCLGNAKDGNIITIDVHPLYRRRGLGRRLLVQMLREFRARNIAQAISQIALDNLPLSSFIKAWDFKSGISFTDIIRTALQRMSLCSPCRRSKVNTSLQVVRMS